MHLIAPSVGALVLTFLPNAIAQASDSSGYTDYSLKLSGDPDSVIYETATTDTSNGTLLGPPDVYLNASVHVGEIDILVQSLSAKLNLDAQVLDLLTFNAGVDLEIGKVKLQIQNVTAEVELEVRLENLVKMIDDVLDSVDLNPVIAELGSSVGTIAGDVGSALGPSSTSAASTSRATTSTGNSGASNSSAGSTLSGRSQVALQQQILYSLNDYSGNTHTNRVLERDGDVVDQSLNNDGHVYASKVVGTYQTLMQKVGSPRPGVMVDGMVATQQEYVYVPSHLGSFGLEVVCYVYTGSDGKVIAARVVAEVEGGGYSTISDTSDEDD